MATPVLCPLECVRYGCPEPDFLEKNGAWLLSVIAGLCSCMGMTLTYFLKSRCREIACCGVQCTRDVVEIKTTDANVTSSKDRV
jgi:hypothetical protein